jgi:hypothetical protein
MGWKFPFNSTIKTPEDVFDPSVVLLTPDSVTPVLEQITTNGGTGGTNSTGNRTGTAAGGIAPGESRQFGFLGTKGSGKKALVVIVVERKRRRNKKFPPRRLFS